MSTDNPPAAPNPTPAPPAAAVPAPSKPSASKLRIIIPIAVILLVMIAVWMYRSFGTVSTDDAYVNSHVTFVAPRVAGQVAKVLVDDNNRVHKGDILVQLDKEPYEIQVALKKAALDTARANVTIATDTMRSNIAQARSLRFKLEHAIEDVDNKVALIKANVAALDKAKASLTLAQAEFDRAKQLVAGKVTSHEEFDQRQAALSVAQADVSEAMQNVFQSRAALGLPTKLENIDELDAVPPDIDQTFSSVRQAQADLIQAASILNVTASSFNLTPRQMIDEFYKRDPQGNIDRIYAQILQDSPTIKQAQANLASAESDLRNAELNLRYCDIIAEIDGVVTRRNVNPGNNVQVGQSLMAIRSLTEVWVDANFKETQIANLRIGLPVDIETDLYGRKKLFKGRISGFTMGTGSTLALLPAENATGNFVKVVQRIPVRIDLVDYDPDKEPLFVGASVTPEVHIRETPTGPSAGKFLQPSDTTLEVLKAPAPSPTP